MRNFCERIATLFYKHNIIQYDDINPFRFAVELIITQIFTFGSIFIIGIARNMILETIIYCFFFIWARRIFEGYHAKTFTMCYILTILFYVVILNFSSLNLPFIYLNILSFIMIVLYVKNHFNNRMIGIICYSFFYGISIYSFYWFKYDDTIKICSLVLFCVLLVSNLGGKNNEYCNR